MILPSESAYAAAALYIAATHGQKLWQCAPRMAIISPKEETGKTRLMEIIEALCYKPFKTGNSTPAALFRSITPDPPTILHDEVDSIFSSTRHPTPGAEELRGFYNAGFSRGEQFWRCLPSGDPAPFNTFAMAVLCSIHDLPRTLMSRSVVVRMRRKSEATKLESLRVSKLKERSAKLRGELTKWVRTIPADFPEPEMPVFNRAADVWEPLIAVADHAGGEWPERARLAAKELTEAKIENSIMPDDLKLLSDIRDVWPADEPRIHTRDLLVRLNQESDLGWSTYERGGELGPMLLAKLLQPYEIKSTQVRIGSDNRQGFYRATFDEAWSSYLVGPS
ncbi:uncharacterized protein DUF3631 [Pseudonocardia cypriaca]|uniref:Uncharacterized protein DUF3631 n=1 Tax=Pseudonocardia cypriaca TaxID=882449 RepID=A0A543GDG0_9PSEU|nr:uncharacterized protein DUF3631 [Pseudonocardia cypriaca]